MALKLPSSGRGLLEFDIFVRHGIPAIAAAGNDAGSAQTAREQPKMPDDLGRERTEFCEGSIST